MRAPSLPLLASLLLACGTLLPAAGALAREPAPRGRAGQEFARLPSAPMLPAAPRPIAPGSLNTVGDWTRPVVFGGARIGFPNEIRLYLCPRGGTPGRNGRCVPQPGPSGLLAGGRGGGESVEGWHGGLRPASHAQRGCPAGTVPTQARDNPGVTRCLPG